MAPNQTSEGGFLQEVKKIFNISQDSLNSTEKVEDANNSKEGSTPSTETSLRSSSISVTSLRSSVKSLKEDASEQLASDESQERRSPRVDKSKSGLRRSSLMVDMLSGEILDDMLYDSEAEDDDEDVTFERVH